MTADRAIRELPLSTSVVIMTDDGQTVVGKIVGTFWSKDEPHQSFLDIAQAAGTRVRLRAPELATIIVVPT